MQRRLIATIIGIVVGAILLTGVVTFVLASHAARDRTRQELVTQARDFAAGYKADLQGAGTPPDTTTAARLANLLQLFRGPLRDEADAIVIVGPGGRLRDVSQAASVVLPNGLTTADLQPSELLAGNVVSGVKGPVVFAAAPLRIETQTRRAAQVFSTSLVQAVILTRKPSTGLRDAAPWFLLAALIVVAVAAVVGDRLGRRISRPLLAAETVTRQIAAGDLSAQVALPEHAYSELESLAGSINTMAANLARSKGLERQFLLSVSHDLRTPLTSIRGFAEAIAEGAAPDNTRAAEVIAAEARRLERLVQDLLELAKLDARRFGLDMRRTDLSEVVADTAVGFRPAAEELGLHLSVEPGPPGAVMASADPDRLAQALANLVENALKFAATSVRVGVRSLGDHATIWVDDDGPGIGADDLPRVFDRLFMSSRHPARQVGSGLGLAIVAELVGAMGGTVTAQSPILAVTGTGAGASGGGGTRMVVTLPSWSRTTEPSLSAV